MIFDSMSMLLLIDPPSSPLSQWSFANNDELDKGDLEEEDEEVQAGDGRYIREDTPAVGYVPLPKVGLFDGERINRVRQMHQFTSPKIAKSFRRWDPILS